MLTINTYNIMFFRIHLHVCTHIFKKLTLTFRIMFTQVRQHALREMFSTPCAERYN